MIATETKDYLQKKHLVAVKWFDAFAKPVGGWQFKIVKVKEVLSDGIIDETDKVWRKPKEGSNECVHGHATMRPVTLFQHMMNTAEWEIREIFWDDPDGGRLEIVIE